MKYILIAILFLMPILLIGCSNKSFNLVQVQIDPEAAKVWEY